MNALFRMILLARSYLWPLSGSRPNRGGNRDSSQSRGQSRRRVHHREGVVAKIFTSKSGNTFLNIGAVYPN